MAEWKMREHFESMISDARLLELPLSVLSRMIRTDAESIQSVLEFLRKCLNEFESAASILFRKFDISQPSVEEIQELECDKRIDWSGVGGQGGELVCGLISRCLRDERRMHELIEENQTVRKETEEIRRELQSSLARFEREFEEERQSLGNEFVTLTAALRGRHSEETARLRSQVIAMEEATTALSLARCKTLIKAVEFEMEQQHRENEELRHALER
jgi:hypothetical protein